MRRAELLGRKTEKGVFLSVSDFTKAFCRAMFHGRDGIRKGTYPRCTGLPASSSSIARLTHAALSIPTTEMRSVLSSDSWLRKTSGVPPKASGERLLAGPGSTMQPTGFQKASNRAMPSGASFDETFSTCHLRVRANRQMPSRIIGKLRLPPSSQKVNTMSMREIIANRLA